VPSLRDAYAPEGPDGPDLILADHPAVVEAIEQIATGTAVEQLGGTMSRNLHLRDPGLVLRIHQPFVSRRRVVAERRLKRATVIAGVGAAEPVAHGRRETFTIAGRVAEVERYAPHTKPAATWQSYRWLYEVIGRLHQTWATVDDLRLPRPLVATYGPPATVRRYLLSLRGRLAPGPGKAELERVTALVQRLGRRWIPAGQLPSQLVHGDARLGNLSLRPDGSALVLDLGFTAVRPRVHDLAYAMAWIMLRPDDSGLEAGFAVDEARRVIDSYEVANGHELSVLERTAFDQYLAAVPLYLSAMAAFMGDPSAHLLTPSRMRLVDISEWVLAHPGAITG